MKIVKRYKNNELKDAVKLRITLTATTIIIIITYNLKYGRVEGEKGRQEIDANESARYNY